MALPTSLWRLVLVVVTAGATSLFGQTNDSIAKRQGELFLRMIEAYGTLGEPNSLEAAFHLCELAAPQLAETSQRHAVQEQLDGILTLRHERNRRVAAQIERSNRPRAYRNEYHTAQFLFRLISHQVVHNLRDENFDGEAYKFLAEDSLQERFGESEPDPPGYKISCSETIRGASFDCCAVPEDYPAGGVRSFCVMFEAGRWSLMGSDFKGQPVDWGAKDKLSSLSLDRWVE